MIYYFQNKPLDPVLLEVYTVHVQSSFVLILQYIFFIIPHICISNMQTNHFLTLFFSEQDMTKMEFSVEKEKKKPSSGKKVVIQVFKETFLIQCISRPDTHQFDQVRGGGIDPTPQSVVLIKDSLFVDFSHALLADVGSVRHTQRVSRQLPVLLSTQTHLKMISSRILKIIDFYRFLSQTLLIF